MTNNNSIQGTRYLLDTNVLVKVKQYRQNKFFLNNVEIPEDVLDEMLEPSDIDNLRKLKFSTSLSVLKHLKKIMGKIPNNDTKLIDLYNNKGKADPVLIACALAAKEADADKLLPLHNWIIVTDDKAVREKAKEFEIEVLTGNDFKKLLVQAEHGNLTAHN